MPRVPSDSSQWNVVPCRKPRRSSKANRWFDEVALAELESESPSWYGLSVEPHTALVVAMSMRGGAYRSASQAGNHVDRLQGWSDQPPVPPTLLRSNTDEELDEIRRERGEQVSSPASSGPHCASHSRCSLYGVREKEDSSSSHCVRSSPRVSLKPFSRTRTKRSTESGGHARKKSFRPHCKSAAGCRVHRLSIRVRLFPVVSRIVPP